MNNACRSGQMQVKVTCFIIILLRNLIDFEFDNSIDKVHQIQKGFKLIANKRHQFHFDSSKKQM